MCSVAHEHAETKKEQINKVVSLTATIPVPTGANGSMYNESRRPVAREALCPVSTVEA